MELFLIAIIILILVLVYIIYNLYKKISLYEDTIIKYDEILKDTLLRMDKIDSSGVFKADDEVGLVFDGLKTVLKQIQDLIYEEEEK